MLLLEFYRDHFAPVYLARCKKRTADLYRRTGRSQNFPRRLSAFCRAVAGKSFSGNDREILPTHEHDVPENVKAGLSQPRGLRLYQRSALLQAASLDEAFAQGSQRQAACETHQGPG